MTRTVLSAPSTEPVPQGLCDAVQGHVCRMAADAPLHVAATAVARHVRECGRCGEFVDELERLRRWLRTVPLPRELAGKLDAVEPIACAALSRELFARFARDLLAAARGRSRRPVEERVRDQRRLAAVNPASLHGHATDASTEDAAAVDLALRDGAIQAAAALEAAAHLDPLGLDIALAWLGSLERAGRGALAHRLTDKMLARLA